MIIDKNAIEEITQFNIGDEVVSRASGIKSVVVYQEGRNVTTWHQFRSKSSFGYVYLSPAMQVHNVFEIKKTGKSYPELAEALSEMLEE